MGCGRKKGIATIEFALIAPIVLLILAGVLNYSTALRIALAAADAARAGAQYGSLTPSNSVDIAGMEAAALNAAPGVNGLTATAVQFCQCPGGVAVSCSGSCSGKMLVYVTVTTQTTAPNLFSYPGLSFSGN